MIQTATHDPQRHSRAGIAVVGARIWVTVLVAVGAVQLYFVLRAMTYYMNERDALASTLFWLTFASVVLRIVVAAMGFYLLTYGRSRNALYGAIAAMLFFEPFGELLTRAVLHFVAMHEFELRLFPIPGSGAAAISLAVALCLLLSQRSNAAYGLSTRARFADGTPRLWRALRGRQLFE